PEAPVIARYIAGHSSDDAKIGIFGSEPEIYFYAHRRSATGYLYMYDLVSPQPYARSMQEEMIADFEKNKPEFIVSVPSELSWGLWPTADRHVFAWGQAFLNQNYKLVGVAILEDHGTKYYWDEEVRRVNFTPKNFV